MGPADLQTPTPPADCALVLAVPLNFAEFVADLEAGATMEYARNHVLLGRTPEDAWAATGEPLAAVAREVAEIGDELGVLVCAQSSLVGLSEAFRHRCVVTIVAHWRAALLVASDFVGEPAALFDAIRAGNSEVHRDLAARLDPARVRDVLASANPRMRAGNAAELLNVAVITSDHPLPGCHPGGGEIVYRPLLEMRHRDVLDAAFPDLLRPGNRVELRNGLHSPHAVAACIPEGWSGIVDLALCHSAVVAKAIKDGRPERRVAYSQNEVVPTIRLRIVRDLYRRLAQGERNYGQELFDIFKSLSALALEPHRSGR